MSLISYQDKVALNPKPEVADINKITDDDMNEIKEVVNSNSTNTNNNFGDSYSTSNTYNVGDYCVYEDRLYRCITAVSTAESFDSDKWENTTVFDEIKIKNLITSGGETKAGYQIDGKDVYVKRFFISALPNNKISYYNHNLNINDVKFVKYDGFAYTDDTYIMMSYYNPKYASSSLGLYLTNTQIGITTGDNFSSYQATIDIYYTYR